MINIELIASVDKNLNITSKLIFLYLGLFPYSIKDYEKRHLDEYKSIITFKDKLKINKFWGRFKVLLKKGRLIIKSVLARKTRWINYSNFPVDIPN